MYAYVIDDKRRYVPQWVHTYASIKSTVDLSHWRIGVVQEAVMSRQHTSGALRKYTLTQTIPQQQNYVEPVGCLCWRSGSHSDPR